MGFPSYQTDAQMHDALLAFLHSHPAVLAGERVSDECIRFHFAHVHSCADITFEGVYVIGEMSVALPYCTVTAERLNAALLLTDQGSEAGIA
jgi:hypothetical protein